MAEKKVQMTQEQLFSAFAGENQRLEDLNQRINMLIMGLNEITMALLSMDAIKKEKDKIMVPLGAGIFLQAQTEDNENVVFALAGEVMKTKKLEEAKQEIEKRKESLEKLLENTKREHHRTATNVNALTEVIRKGQEFIQQQRMGTIKGL